MTDLGALALAEGGPTGEHGGNSAFRLAGVWGRIVVDEYLSRQLAGINGPVLLVDDLVDSRWTMTVAGRELRPRQSFDDLAGVHDEHAVAQLLDHADVV